MKNWKEYILTTFQPISDFKVDDKTQDGEIGIYSLTHKLTRTSFDFIFPEDDWKKIGDVQFHNPKTNGWSGEFWISEFNEKEKCRLDEFLKPALETGWSSKDYFLNGEHFKSTVYWNKEFKGKNFQYYSNGLSSIFFFPYFWIVRVLMDLKIINGMRKIIIEPIK